MIFTHIEFLLLEKFYEELLDSDAEHSSRSKEWHEMAQKALVLYEKLKEDEEPSTERLRSVVNKVVASSAVPSSPAAAIVTQILGSPHLNGTPVTPRNVEQFKEVLQRNDEHRKNVEATADVIRKIAYSRPIEKDWAVYIPFSETDPAWLYALVVAVKHPYHTRGDYYRHPIPLKSYTYPLPTPSAAPLRVAIVGDIGTNDSHHAFVLHGIRLQNPDLVIHLGDIYVAGTEKECEKFWTLYKGVFGDNPPPLWAIPGNHEYIAAGQGFFNKLLGKNRLGSSTNPQEASFFCLESEPLQLQIIGVDTGFKSTNFSLPIGGEQMDYTTFLDDKEAAWAQKKLKEAKDKNWRTIFLMHHQLFSSYWKDQYTSPRLVEQIAMQPNNIVSWVWGHEHKISVYPEEHTIPTPNGQSVPIRNAHCLGHGACPTMEGSYGMDSANPNKYLEMYTPEYVAKYKDFGGVYNNGFMMLTGEPSTKELKMQYFQVNYGNGKTAETTQGISRIIK